MSGFSGQDVTQLSEKLDAAIVAIPDVAFAGGYPVYPAPIREFTDYISRSPWHRRDYIEDMKNNLDERIETLSLGEVRSYLTFLIRIDRFSPGGLLGKLQDGSAKRVVDRALELVRE